MSSVEDTEVFIPQQARVVTVPARLLPSSVTKKMPLSPAHSDRPATFISPVELRIKGTTRKPRPLTPGQFFLPVLTSNSEAFKILQDFLLSGQTSLQVSESSGARSAFCRRRNSIVLFNKQIFLIVRKAKEPDWPLEGQSTSLSKCEAPPLSSPVKTQDGGSAITEGRSKEDGREAEDDGVMECEA
ncbi:enolase-phosphatase E1-like, partial [Clarias magur]